MNRVWKTDCFLENVIRFKIVSTQTFFFLNSAAASRSCSYCSGLADWLEHCWKQKLDKLEMKRLYRKSRLGPSISCSIIRTIVNRVARLKEIKGTNFTENSRLGVFIAFCSYECIAQAAVPPGGRDLRVGIASSNSGEGEIFRARLDRSWGLPSLAYRECRHSFAGLKRPGAWR